MSTISIPGPVANQLRQGLTLRMGDAAQGLEEASLIDRRKRSYETFVEHFEQIDAIRALFGSLGWRHEPDPTAVEVNLDAYRPTMDAGLSEATAVLRRFTEEGSHDDRRQAVIDLGEMERFTASLPTVIA
jgi:hypothetical protein